MALKKMLFSPGEMGDAIERITHAILEEFGGDAESFALVGLYRQGVPLAERIAECIRSRTGKNPLFGRLDISMYRDDVGCRSGLPLIRETVIPFDVDGMKLILVDDVLSTGRTIRAALDAVTDYGRPDLIRLAVMLDRGSPEYPIRADYVGFHYNGSPGNKIAVLFDEDGEEDGIYEVEWQHPPVSTEG